MEMEDRIAKWERVAMRLAGFAAIALILLIVLVYATLEGVKFLIDRFGN